MIISSVQCQTPDAKTPDKTTGNANDEQNMGDTSTIQTSDPNLSTEAPDSEEVSSMNSLASESTSAAPDTSAISSTEISLSSSSTAAPDIGVISSPQTSVSDPTTAPKTGDLATSTAGDPNANTPKVATTAGDVSSTEMSNSDETSTVAPDTKTKPSAQPSETGHSTGSIAHESGNDTVSTSANTNRSNTSTTNTPDAVSSTSKTPQLTPAKDGNRTGEDEVPTEHECTKVGRFSHPTSCTKYYYCWDNSGWPFEFTCPEHRAFDPVTQHCVINYGVCAMAPKCETDKQVIPNPDDKWTFFQCKIDRDDSNGFELHCKACAQDREYDEQLGYCKLTSTTGEMVVDSDELIDEVACGETGLFIDYEDDTKFYECVVQSVAKGILKPVHHKCPIYHVFSMHERRCVPLSMLARLNETYKMNNH